MVAGIVAHLVPEGVLHVGGRVVEVRFPSAVGERGTVTCREAECGVETRPGDADVAVGHFEGHCGRLDLGKCLCRFGNLVRVDFQQLAEGEVGERPVVDGFDVLELRFGQLGLQLKQVARGLASRRHQHLRLPNLERERLRAPVGDRDLLFGEQHLEVGGGDGEREVVAGLLHQQQRLLQVQVRFLEPVVFAHAGEEFRADRERRAEVGVGGVFAELVGCRVEDAPEGGARTGRGPYGGDVVETRLPAG